MTAAGAGGGGGGGGGGTRSGHTLRSLSNKLVICKDGGTSACGVAPGAAGDTDDCGLDAAEAAATGADTDCAIELHEQHSSATEERCLTEKVIESP